MISTCFLCGIDLEPDDGFQRHPEIETCLVRFTDELGIAIDLEQLAPQEAPEIVSPTEFFGELDIRLFPFVDEVLIDIFAKYEVPRLGGVSTGRGWSAFSTFQRCPYLYKRRYVDPIETASIIPSLESEARAVGTVIHALLAVYYSRMIIPEYPLTPELLRDELIQKANPEFINEGWRVFLAYALFYQDEDIQPLAVEYDLRDPRTNESCRFDLIAYFPTAHSDRLPGTYNIEHKCLVAGTRVFDPEVGRDIPIEDRDYGKVTAYADLENRRPSVRHAKAARVESMGLTDVARVVTDHGRVVECSLNHPFYTLSGWKELSDLTTEDWVAIPRRLSAPEAKGELLDEEAALLGYLIGDGYLGETVRLTKTDTRVLERVETLAAKLGWPTKRFEYVQKAPYIGFLGGRDRGVYDMLRAHGLLGCTAEGKFIPTIAFSDAQIRLIVAGLFDTDGSIDVHIDNGFAKPRIAYVTCSERLAFDVLHLLDRLGLEGSCRASSVEYQGERRPVWTTKVVGRDSKRRFLSMIICGDIPAVRLKDVAAEAIDQLIDCSDEPVPRKWIIDRIEPDQITGVFRQRLKSRHIGLGNLAEFHPELMKEFEALPFRWERVESVVCIGRAEVFNVEVPTYHNLVTNGVITHNSAGRFDDATLNGWANDGEVLGQMMLWDRLKLDLRFGKLRGTVVNILGKQKESKFHRTTVAPETWQTRQHKSDLRQWEAHMHMARATGVFPRSRAGCIGRFGKCDLYDHCATVAE